MTTEDKLIEALKTISFYVRNKRPNSLAAASDMLDIIEVIASETVAEIKEELAPAA